MLQLLIVMYTEMIVKILLCHFKQESFDMLTDMLLSFLLKKPGFIT